MKIFKSLILLFLPLALFAQETLTEGYRVTNDVIWATPGNMELHMDIYSPEDSTTPLPVLIIYHGGGWLINTKSIMDEMSQYIASTGKYVVCNVDYRLLTANNNTTSMKEIVEDAMGAVLWVKEHIADYGGDPEKVAVTGDSAGGQLAAMVLNGQEDLGEISTPEKLSFKPTYIPEGITVAEIRQKHMLDVQAAILSYPAVDLLKACLGDGQGNGFESVSNFFWQMGQGEPRGIFGDSINASQNPGYYKQVSPVYTIPKTRKLPPVFCHVGANDQTTTPASIKAYADSLEQSGVQVTYKVYPGKPHAYLDSGSNDFLKISFEKDAIGPIEDIIAFMDGIFY
jgi:acetyl esterase/lipase